jgi:asparagine synthase (glutamine-hydrolysing)
VAQVRHLLREAVRKRLVADVPVGLLLSGGVDSAAVAAFMAQEAPGQVRTFTVGFEGDAYWDERAAAREIATHLGTEHHDSVVKPQAAQLVETLLHHHDEPFGDSSALPTYLVAQEARRHVTVALNGDGGDETFAGYDRFWAALLAASLPDPLKRVMRRATAVLPRAPMHAFLPRLRRFAQKAALPLDERLFSWGAFFDLDALRAIDADHLARPSAVLASYRAALAECAHASPLSQALHLDFRTYLLDDLLPKMDRMTMAHGLEGRSPLLDTALVEYVAALPDDYKRRGRHGKIILKEAIRDLVPPSVLTRRKHGFGVPLGQWFRGELRPMVEDLLQGQARVLRWVRADALARLLQEHQSGRHDHGHRLWTLLTLELWLRRHRFA